MNSQSGHDFLASNSPLVGSCVEFSTSMRSDVNAISPLVDELMILITNCHCLAGQEEDVEVALREALANAVLHGNQQNIYKRAFIRCHIRFGKLSIIVQDEGAGFDPTNLPDPTDIANISSSHGRGIYLMRA
jgi:serine/threonine-protein kinase RsbW